MADTNTQTDRQDQPLEPNLRRILCHEDFKGHALRKDYPINRRQTLSRPVEMILTDDPDWA